jgi:hypothetical protein
MFQGNVLPMVCGTPSIDEADQERGIPPGHGGTVHVDVAILKLR